MNCTITLVKFIFAVSCHVDDTILYHRYYYVTHRDWKPAFYMVCITHVTILILCTHNIMKICPDAHVFVN